MQVVFFIYRSPVAWIRAYFKCFENYLNFGYSQIFTYQVWGKFFIR